jgi:type I restriction enzyme R subunit
VLVEGFEVHITDAGRYIVTSINGRAMPVTVEEYKQRLAAQLVKDTPTLDAFRSRWVDPATRHEMLSRLPEGARSAYLVQRLEEMDDYDLYDVLGDLGYGLAPRTRDERSEAFTYKHTSWLQALPPAAAATVRAIAAQFARGGTEGLENPRIFQTPQVSNAGGLAALRAVGEPAEVLKETKERMFAA